MPKPRLTTLKPTLGKMPSRLQTLGGGGCRPGSAGIRWTGRKLQDWRARILRAEPLCRPCKEKGITTLAQEVDHVIPLEQGGTYDETNACPICIPCHKAKTARERANR